MDKKLMKTNDRQVSMIIITLIIGNVLALIMMLLIKNSKMIILGIMILTSIIIYIMIKQVFTKFYRQLDYLIACSDMIIENNNKHLEIIDGEGKISILSHKLYILNERFFILIEGGGGALLHLNYLLQRQTKDTLRRRYGQGRRPGSCPETTSFLIFLQKQGQEPAAKELYPTWRHSVGCNLARS